MKRLSVLFLSFLLLCSLSVSAAAVEPQCCDDYFLTGGITQLDYNGSIYVGLNEGRIITSTDFDHWSVRRDLPLMTYQGYVGGNFVAFRPGESLYSPDGIHFTWTENNLPSFQWSPTQGPSVVGDRFYLPVYTETEDYLIYTSSDGIYWELVYNVWFRDLTFKYLNGRYFIVANFQVFVSDDGVNFTPIEAPYTDINFWGGRYYCGGPAFHPDQLYTSTDLITWTEADPALATAYPYQHWVVESGGTLYAYPTNPDTLRYVFNGEMWVYERATAFNVDEYRFTPFGLLATGENRFAAKFTNFAQVDLFFDASKYTGGRNSITRFRDGAFLSLSALYYSPGSIERYVRRSTDGLNWEQLPWEDWYQDFFYNSITTASNGAVSLTLDPYAVPVTGTLTYADGSTFPVAYEFFGNGKPIALEADPVSGLFSMEHSYGAVSALSPDGVTRYWYPNIASVGNGLVLSWYNQDLLRVEDGKTLLSQLSIPSIRVQLNGEFLGFATPPVVQDGSTLVPVRFLFERAGATVTWDPSSQITISYQGRDIQLTLGSSVAVVDGKEVSLPVPPQLFEEKTLIPLRFVSEQLGFTVSYDAANHIAAVITPAETN